MLSTVFSILTHDVFRLNAGECHFTGIETYAQGATLTFLMNQNERLLIFKISWLRLTRNILVIDKSN